MTTKTFISNNSSYTVYDNNLTIFGRSGGTEIVRIRAGVTGITLDANIERIDLSETLVSYKFVFVAGTGFQIQKDGSVVATLASINQDVKIAFYDGAATLAQTGRSAFTLGNSAVSTEAAGGLSPSLSIAAADYSTFRLIVTKDTGDISVINAAFGAYSGTTATVTATGMDASQITAVVSGVAKIATGGITGAISLSNVQFGTLSTALNASATLTVTDTNLAATALAAMDTKSNPNPVNASLVTTITGTASEIAAFAAATGITRAGTFAATMSDAATLAQLATIDGANGGGALTYATVTGIAADFAATGGVATTGNTTYVSGKNVTVTNAATLAQLATIDTANGAGTLTYTAVTDLAQTLATNAGGYVTGAINVTVTDSVEVAATLLSQIGGATTGKVTAADVSTVTGSASEVTAALVTVATKVTTAANPIITLSDAGSVAATVLSAIGGLTTGAVTAPNVTTVTGLTSEVTAALITSATLVTLVTTATNPIITLNDSGSIAATVLSAIGGVTSGSVTGSNISAVTGSASEIVAALVDTNTKVTVAVNAAITISDAPNVTQLKAINNATTGAITLGDAGGALSGSAADLFDALAGTITTHTGTVQITTQPTVAQLKAINNATSGAITLGVTGGALVDIAADLFAALTGITTYTGTVKITDAATVAQLTEINAATSASITAASTTLTGTAAAIKVVTDAIGSSDGKIKLGTMTGEVSNVPVTVSNAPTVEELKSINNATSGAITLNDTSGTLSGNTVDLFDALMGITNYAGAVTISNQPNVAELKAINDATSGAITLTDASGALSGVAADVASALAGTITTHTGAVTITDSPSLVATLLSTINGKTGGLITAANVTTLTGSATEITAVTNAAADQISLLTLSNLILSDAVSAATFNSTVFTQSPITITLANASGNVMTSVDTTVNSTKVLKIDGGTLTGANALTFNGTLETNGKFSVTGGAGADSITGGSGADTIAGGLGNDAINGGAGADIINGNDGDDVIDGGIGNDYIWGDDGGDVINGGAGIDNINGGAGIDNINGGDGADAINGGTGADVINGGAGGDRYVIGDVGESTIASTAWTAAGGGSTFATTGMDIVTFATGDTLDLSAIAATLISITRVATTIIASTSFTAAGTQTSAESWTGTYSNGTFTSATNGVDTMLIYDNNGSESGGTLEGIILVGLAGTATIADGVITFA